MSRPGVWGRLKAATRMLFASGSAWNWLLPRTRYDYEREVGDGQGSSVIMAPALWIARTFQEAPVGVLKDGEIDTEHPMALKIERPNPFYSAHVLWMATLLSFVIRGNAYWRKIRNRMKGVAELWYIPDWLMEPRWSPEGTDYVSHYEYKPMGLPERVEVEDIVHFRYGLDPRNTRLGLSPLYSLLREVFTDDEAANFTATLLRNFGLPGLVISPASDAVVVEPEDKNAVKEFFQTGFGGERRGDPLVMRAATKVEQLGFNPQQMDLARLREIPEERVTAVLGIPAAVVGFGTGLQQTKVGATMAEMRQMAYESGIMPLQRLIGAELESDLLPDFEAYPETMRVAFDLSDIASLREDRNKLSERLLKLYSGNAITRATLKRELGYEVQPEDEVYLLPVNFYPVNADGSMTMPEPQPTAQPANTNGKSKMLLPHAPGLKRSPWRGRLMLAFRRDEERLAPPFSRGLQQHFEKLGQAVADAWLQTAEQWGIDYGKAGRAEVKRTLDEAVIADLIASGISWVKWLLPYSPHYSGIARATAATIEAVIGLGVNLTDQAEVRIVAEGGRRAGLIDLSTQTRESLFKTLSEAREAGEGPVAAARRIRDQIAAGPWSSSKVRADVIARTETKYAQNVSSLEVYRASDTIRAVELVDAQLGPTDEVCEARNGQIVSFQEAEAALLEEHPNGTLSLSPVVEGA